MTRLAFAKFGMLVLPLFVGVPGCQTVSLTGVDNGPYVLRDAGRRGEFKVLEVTRENHIIPAGPRVDLILVPPGTDDQAVRRIVKRSNSEELAPYRLTDLGGAALHATRELPVAQGRWIVGINPLTVTVGEDVVRPNAFDVARLKRETGAVVLSSSVRLPKVGDLGHLSKLVYVFDRPGPWRESYRVIHLPQPVPLETLLDSIPQSD